MPRARREPPRQGGGVAGNQLRGWSHGPARHHAPAHLALGRPLVPRTVSALNHHIEIGISASAGPEAPGRGQGRSWRRGGRGAVSIRPAGHVGSCAIARFDRGRHCPLGVPFLIPIHKHDIKPADAQRIGDAAAHQTRADHRRATVILIGDAFGPRADPPCSGSYRRSRCVSYCVRSWTKPGDRSDAPRSPSRPSRTALKPVMQRHQDGFGRNIGFTKPGTWSGAIAQQRERRPSIVCGSYSVPCDGRSDLWIASSPEPTITQAASINVLSCGRLVNKSEAKCFRRRDRLAIQQHLHRGLKANQSRQSLCAT